jgi:hypothetical protein
MGPSLISPSSIVGVRSGVALPPRGASSSRIGCRRAGRGAEDQRHGQHCGYARWPRRDPLHREALFDPEKSHAPGEDLRDLYRHGVRVGRGSAIGQSRFSLV